MTYFPDKPKDRIEHTMPCGLITFLVIILMLALGIIILLIFQSTDVLAQTDSEGLTQGKFIVSQETPQISTTFPEPSQSFCRQIDSDAWLCGEGVYNQFGYKMFTVQEAVDGHNSNNYAVFLNWDNWISKMVTPE